MVTKCKIYATLCLMIIIVVLLLESVNFQTTQMVLNYIPLLSNKTTELTKPTQCRPKTNIMFLKVHKAGSSTVFNVLGRFLVNNRLNMAIPNKPSQTSKYNYLGLGSYLTEDMILPLPEGKHYNMLFNHVVYNRTFFNKILPNDTFYFAIIRNPEERFLSAAKYFGLVSSLSKQNPRLLETSFFFENFLKDPEKFGYTNKVHNGMAHDFGVPLHQYSNKSFVKDYITKLDTEFNLVLLMEYFDESLIMLRRKLCWSLKDVLYVKQNAGSKPKNPLLLTDNDRRRLQEFQFADIMIYEHFHKRFWSDIQSFGIDIHYETSHFKDVRRRMESFCSGFAYLQDKFIRIEETKWNSAFNITVTDCNILKMEELPLLDIIKSSLIKRLPSSKLKMVNT